MNLDRFSQGLPDMQDRRPSSPPMHMGIRIKASDDPSDLLALEMVRGRVTEGTHPKFVFNNDMQRNRYDNLRKRLKGGESLESIGKAHTPTVKKLT